MSGRDLAKDEPNDGRERPFGTDVVAVSRSRDARASLSLLLLIVDLIVLFMSIGGVHGPLRFVFGLIFGVVVPGWSIVGLLHLANAALEVGLTIAVSLALLLVLAQILMTVHLWHLGALETFLCLACLPSLVRLSRRHGYESTSPS